MPGLRELYEQTINDPDALTYYAMRDNPALARQLEENDKRNYLLMQAQQLAAQMPKMADIPVNNNPNNQWFNNQNEFINQLVKTGNPAVMNMIQSMVPELQKQMAQNMQLTAQQKELSDIAQYGSPQYQDYARKRLDPAFVPGLQHQYDMAEKEREYALRNKASQFEYDLRTKHGGLGKAQIYESDKGPVALNPDTMTAKKFTLDGQPLKPGMRPATEHQRWLRDYKEDQFKYSLQDTLKGINDTLYDYENLKAIQKKTTTGPVTGWTPIATARKILPDEISGGKNLQRLEKGYNKTALKTIAALKQIGLTFGALTTYEEEWVKSTESMINNDEEINQEIMEQGERMLKERQIMIQERLQDRSITSSGTTGSWGDSNQGANDTSSQGKNDLEKRIADWFRANPEATEYEYNQWFNRQQ